MKQTYLTRQEFIDRFSDGLEKERHCLGMTQTEMAAELEMSLSAYKRIINGETAKINLYTCYRIYLLTGKLAFELVGASDPKLDIIGKLHGLSAQQLSFIGATIDFECNFSNSDIPHKEDYVSVFIPTGNMEDGMIFDSSNIEKVNIANYRQKFGSSINCGLRITSSHFHPVYNLNDVLLICKGPIRHGDTGIFVNKKSGCVYIRKFHQANPCLLESINGYGNTFTFDTSNHEEMAQWILFGYVLTKIR